MGLKKEELTIVFSEYNTLNETSKAVESFLHFHPQYKENVIIFDDNSTDGSFEYFLDKGFKVIRFDESLRLAPQYEKAAMVGFHVSEVMKQVIMNVNTKWLFHFHNDVIFKKEFMSEFEQADIDEYDIYCPFGGAEVTEKIETLPEFDILYSKKHKCYIRYWEVFMLLNLHRLKELGITYANYESEELLSRTLPHCLLGAEIDTGAKFTLDCINNNDRLNIFNFSDEEIREIIDHEMGIETGSSKQRDIEQGIGRNYYERRFNNTLFGI